MNQPETRTTQLEQGWRPSRRELLGAGAVTVLGGTLAAGLRHAARHEGGLRADVFISKADSYSSDLVGAIADGLREIGVTAASIRGKKVLLKPNLVETARGEPHVNTHPAVIVAAVEVFRRLDAAEVFVAEGQGHRRDSQLVLDESGMNAALLQSRTTFIDLNHDDVAAVASAGRWSTLGKLHLPRTLLSADFIVSMPKLKTHHWAGVTCAMKNLFGVMPGIVYGWPKNVLHYAGIPQSILDINATVKPHLAIVDAVVGMEGDGPIMGTPKPLGCLVVGTNLPAVDATCARLMKLNPYGVEYLTAASGALGPIHEHNVYQRGETIASLASRFAIIDSPHLQGIALS
ncbi:MAG: DUF362 domain-containing protein [Planctomycetota bacterium]